MEFQHSAIDPAERLARENFYVNMVWVVDCTRLSSDRPRIDANMPNWQRLPEGSVESCAVPSAYFPRRWLDSSVPVLFDFNGLATGPDADEQDHLICLMPERYFGDALYFPVRRTTLVKVGNGEATIFDWKQLHLRMIERDKQMLRSAYRRRSLLSRIISR